MSAKEINDESEAVFPRIKSPSRMIYHQKTNKKERPISKVYRMIDNDLARDNLENDMTSADLQDL